MSDEPIGDDVTIDCLIISIRVYNLLKQDGINTVGQIRAQTDMELMRTPGLGKVSLKEIRALTGPHVDDGEVNQAWWHCSTPTPLQALARAIKALSYRDMERLACLIGNENCGDWAEDILAAADKLEAGE